MIHRTQEQFWLVECSSHNGRIRPFVDQYFANMNVVVLCSIKQGRETQVVGGIDGCTGSKKLVDNVAITWTTWMKSGFISHQIRSDHTMMYDGEVIITSCHNIHCILWVGGYLDNTHNAMASNHHHIHWYPLH